MFIVRSKPRSKNVPRGYSLQYFAPKLGSKGRGQTVVQRLDKFTNNFRPVTTSTTRVAPGNYRFERGGYNSALEINHPRSGVGIPNHLIISNVNQIFNSKSRIIRP